MGGLTGPPKNGTVAASKRKPQPKSAPDMSGAVQPTVRTFTVWTPALIQSAEIQADAGNLRYAANVCDWLLTNPIVSSGLRTRVQALLGLDPTFERSGDKRRSNRTVRALEVGEDWWAAYPESELIQLVTWGLLLGVCPFNQAPWTTSDDHGGRVLPTFEVWHPQHLRFDSISREWRIKVSRVGNAGEIEETLVPGDGQWGLHCPFGKNRPWAWGLWRCLADLVLLAEYGWQDWGRVSERAILLVLTCLDGKAADELKNYTAPARQKLATDIYARGSSAVAALPPGIDLKAVQAAVDAKQLQGGLIEAAHKAIAIVIRGGNLTTDVSKGGSKAATETQAEMGDGGNLRFDAQSLTTTIHDQSLVWWAQFNFGDSALAPWPVYPVEPEEDLQAKVETEETAFETCDNAERLGFEVDRGKFLEEHKITWAKPGERPKPIDPTTAQGTQPAEAPAPGAPGVPPPDGEEPAADGKDGKQPPPKPPIKAEARAAILASGTRAAEADGFVDGQAYIDALVAQGKAEIARALQTDVKTLLGVIDRADGPDQLRDLLNEAFAETMDPAELQDLTEKAGILAELAGRTAVLQDL